MTTVTVKASGGDYSSTVTAEATEQKTLGSAEVFFIDCYQGTYGGGGVNYINEDLTVAGWGGLASDAYVEVRAPISENHGGKPFDGSDDYNGFALRSTGSAENGAGFSSGQAYTRVTGIIVGCATTSGYGGRQAFKFDGTTFGLLTDCIAVCQGSVSYMGQGFFLLAGYYGDRTVEVKNSLACGDGSNAWIIGFELVRSSDAYNCISIGNTFGFRGTTQEGDTPIVVNCLGNDNTTDFTGSFANSTNNLSEDATAPGTSAQTSKSLTFADAVNQDYHLVSGDTDAIGNGVGPASNGNVPTTDIDGDARSGTTCDIGFDEFIAAVGGVTVLPGFKNTNTFRHMIGR